MCKQEILSTKALTAQDESKVSPNIPECNAGYHWSSYLMKCVPNCPTGQHNDSITGGCVVDGVATDSITMIKNDPDFKTIANALHIYYDIFVNKKINMSTYNLKDSALFLRITGSTQAQINALVQNIKIAGQRLVARYGFKPSQCITCSATITTQNSAFDSVITNFQNYPSTYTSFTSQSLGISSSAASSNSTTLSPNIFQKSCCGMWFYACCALAAETIEAFPIYLAACGYCFHSECCKS